MDMKGIESKIVLIATRLVTDQQVQSRNMLSFDVLSEDKFLSHPTQIKSNGEFYYDLSVC